MNSQPQTPDVLSQPTKTRLHRTPDICMFLVNHPSLAHDTVCSVR